MSIPPSYTLCRTSRLRSDETINGPGNQPRFYLHHKSLTMGPTHHLLDGPTETSPRLASWKFHNLSDNEVCLGDFEAGNATWIPIESGGIMQKKFSFRSPDTGRVFGLEKSHDKEFGLSRFRNRGYLLTDAGTGKVVAVMRLLSFSSGERCRFEWLEGMSWTEQILCLMAMVGVFQVLSAQNNSSTSSSIASGAAISNANGGGC